MIGSDSVDGKWTTVTGQAKYSTLWVSYLKYHTIWILCYDGYLELHKIVLYSSITLIYCFHW